MHKHTYPTSITQKVFDRSGSYLNDIDVHFIAKICTWFFLIPFDICSISSLGNIWTQADLAVKRRQHNIGTGVCGKLLCSLGYIGILPKGYITCLVFNSLKLVSSHSTDESRDICLQHMTLYYVCRWIAI